MYCHGDSDHVRKVRRRKEFASGGFCLDKMTLPDTRRGVGWTPDRPADPANKTKEDKMDKSTIIERLSTLPGAIHEQEKALIAAMETQAEFEAKRAAAAKDADKATGADATNVRNLRGKDKE